MRDYFHTKDRDTLIPDFGPTVEHVTMWTDERGLARWSVSFETLPAIGA